MKTLAEIIASIDAAMAERAKSQAPPNYTRIGEDKVLVRFSLYPK